MFFHNFVGGDKNSTPLPAWIGKKCKAAGRYWKTNGKSIDNCSKHISYYNHKSCYYYYCHCYDYYYYYYYYYY